MIGSSEDNHRFGSKLRWLLVVDGVFVLLLCVVLLADFIPKLIWRYSLHERPIPGPIVGEKRQDASSRGMALQDIRLLPPRKLPKSDSWVVEIEQRDLQRERNMKQFMLQAGNPVYGPYREPPAFGHISGQTTVNLLIYSKSDPDGFLLFDRQVLIGKVMVPVHPDDPQEYILYSVVLTDSNQDGRLSDADGQSLWISELDGRQLAQITPDSLVLDGFSFSRDKKQIYICAWKRPSEPLMPREHWEQGIYRFDVDRKQIEPIPIDPAHLAKARWLLQH